jgi:hypothetical protein
MAQDENNSYFKLTNIGKDGNVCEVLTDGGGDPVKIRGSIFTKDDTGCAAARAYTDGRIVGVNIMEVTATQAKVGWKNSGYMNIRVNQYGQRRHAWIETPKT